MDLYLKINSLLRVVLLFIGFFVLQSNIIPVSASPIIFDQDHYTNISEARTYDKIEGSVGVEIDLTRVLSKSEVGLSCEDLRSIERSAARGGTVPLKSTVGAARAGFSKLPKGFKQTKQFGYQHGQKVYKYKGKFYSQDIDGHNGGVWKVFENAGGRLKRIGTADGNLNIFKN